jgi:hypothetical protein
MTISPKSRRLADMAGAFMTQRDEVRRAPFLTHAKIVQTQFNSPGQLDHETRPHFPVRGELIF